MKQLFSKVVIGVAGVCIGFALCYFSTTSHSVYKPAGHNVVVTIARDGNLELSGAPIALDRLPGALKAAAAKGDMVTIRADQYANSRSINEVLDACKSCGVTRVALRTPGTP